MPVPITLGPRPQVFEVVAALTVVASIMLILLLGPFGHFSVLLLVPLLILDVAARSSAGSPSPESK